MSSDNQLVRRAQAALVGDERLVRVSPDPNRLGAICLAGTLVVTDSRDANMSTLSRATDSTRYSADPHTPCVVLAGGASRMTVVAQIRDRVTDAIVSDSDWVFDLLRAMLNDETQTAAAARALEVLIACTPTEYHIVFKAILGGGLHESSVKQVCAMLETSPRSLARKLRLTNSVTTTLLVDLATAGYAIVLLRGCALPLDAIAAAGAVFGSSLFG